MLDGESVKQQVKTKELSKPTTPFHLRLPF